MQMENALKTYRQGPQMTALLKQNLVMKSDDQQKHTKRVVDKILEGFQEWQQDTKKVDAKLKKLSKGISKVKKNRSRPTISNQLMQRLYESQKIGSSIQFKARVLTGGKTLIIDIPKKPTPQSISLENLSSSQKLSESSQMNSTDG